ncbi:ATPase inhibitor IATP mitochondria protein [Rutstroemia sp. NJR-2017a BVV2]|nr:ATPase inhibitor IATP mitochondria protein [Rutstroemia sp. NJR-2017a BVV2]
MYRTALTSLRPTVRSTFSPAATRAFSVSARTMAGGDTGASRPGGVAQGDAFTKREKANEDYTIRMREKEKLLELKKKLQEQHEHLKKLENHISDLEKQSDEQK